MHKALESKITNSAGRGNHRAPGYVASLGTVPEQRREDGSGLAWALTAEQGHPWPQGPEALGAVPGEATTRGRPADTDVPGPQEQAPLTRSPTPRAAEKRVALSACGHRAGEHPADSKWDLIPAPARSSFLGSAVGATQLRSAKWPAFPATRKAAAQTLHLPSGSWRTPPRPRLSPAAGTCAREKAPLGLRALGRVSVLQGKEEGR